MMSGIGTGVDGMLYKMDSKALDVVGFEEEKLEGIIEDSLVFYLFLLCFIYSLPDTGDQCLQLTLFKLH